MKRTETEKEEEEEIFLSNIPDWCRNIIINNNNNNDTHKLYTYVVCHVLRGPDNNITHIKYIADSFPLITWLCILALLKLNVCHLNDYAAIQFVEIEVSTRLKSRVRLRAYSHNMSLSIEYWVLLASIFCAMHFHLSIYLYVWCGKFAGGSWLCVIRSRRFNCFISFWFMLYAICAWYVVDHMCTKLFQVI